VYLVKQQGELEDCKQYPILTEKWFSDAIDEIAATQQVGIIDMFHPWLEFCLEKTSIEARKYYAPGENLHPNALGAERLAQIVSEALFPVVKPDDNTGEDPYKDFDTASTVFYEAEVSGGVVANPHKGFVMTVTNHDMLYKGKHPYGIEGSNNNHAWDVVTICSGVMFWEDINPEEGVYNWEEIDDALKACEQAGMTYGIRIIPYTTSKGSDDNYGEEHDFVPQWVYEKGAKQKIVTYKYGDPSVQIKVPDWSDPIYIQAYKDFTKALAERYDGDPRVEYVEIRAFGNMGEWHASEFDGIDMPSVEIQKDMLAYFASVFKKTMCCVLSDARGEVYDYALSLGITKRNNGLIMTKNAEWDLRPAYKANLPTMADNHNTYEHMLDKENKLSAEYLKWTPEHFRECIEIAHLSIYALDQEGYGSYKFYREQKSLIDKMSNRLGYNYTVTSAKRNGNKLLVTVKNTGLAPAFFDIKLSAEITDLNGTKLGDFGEPVIIASGSFRDDTTQTFMFEYDGTYDPDTEICLAMYDVNNYLAAGKDPTVKFDNLNTLPNNRLLLVNTNPCTEHTDSDFDGNCDICGKDVPHEHSGGTATCTGKAKCTYCGAEYGKPAGHKYDERWIPEKRTHSRNCNVCNKATQRADHTWKSTIKKATLNENGVKETVCVVCHLVHKAKIIVAPKTVELSNTAYIYNGKAKKPSVVVKDANGKKISNKNYDVTYPADKTSVGEHTVRVTFKGDYSGTHDLSYVICPPKTSVSSLKAKSQSFIVKWSKKTKEVSGYEIQYSTSATFEGDVETITVTSAETKSETVTGLKGKQKYYVRIRTYHEDGEGKYYSAWSAKKAVKTKK
ncbi:MAG: fibronectin type III domain-containing protein, partial [Lachnospiraceae bacterium]|nr:fibronectin type III domain-containing protein [Lachnospiraceae bacterium]